MAITLRPEVAPIVTVAGARRCHGELRFHGYRATIKTTDETNTTLLELVLDFRRWASSSPTPARLHVRPTRRR